MDTVPCGRAAWKDPSMRHQRLTGLFVDLSPPEVVLGNKSYGYFQACFLLPCFHVIRLYEAWNSAFPS